MEENEGKEKKQKKKMQPKRWLAGLLGIFLAGLAGCMALVIWVDPFFQYHKPLAWFPYLVDNQVNQNPGLAKHMDYDGILIGSSMTASFNTAWFEELMGMKTQKLSYNGSYPKDLSNIMQLVFDAKGDQVKAVYMAVDQSTFSADPEENFLSGYVLLLDRLDGNEYNQLKSFTTYTLRTRHKLEIVYPGEKSLTPGLYEKIKKDFSAFEKTLYSYDYNDKKYGISRLIDAESFADYFIINEFTCNYDAGWLSTYIYKDADGRFRMCIWDFNSACDNYQQSQMDSQHFEMQNCLWYFMLMKDEDFTELCIKRYRQLRKTVLSEEYLNRYIDDTVSYLGPAIERNYEKWGYSFNKKHDMLRPQSRNPRTYGQSIEQMKKFIKERGEWMDDNIESLRQYSAPSKIKKFNEVAN